MKAFISAALTTSTGNFILVGDHAVNECWQRRVQHQFLVGRSDANAYTLMGQKHEDWPPAELMRVVDVKHRQGTKHVFAACGQRESRIFVHF